MHFGEYELSPSLISLSPLPSAHPEAFQRLLVRSSSWCYPAFNLAKGRSLGFASATADYTPSSDSLSLRIRVSSHLTLPAKATRRFIMQKARRHSLTSSDRLQAHGFRNYFTLLFEVLFTFPSRYWFTIGLSGVFSLAGWSRRIRSGLHVSRLTQDTLRRSHYFVYRPITYYGVSFQKLQLQYNFVTPRLVSYNPSPKTGLGCCRFARHYSGNRFFFLFLPLLRCFSSRG